MTRHTNILALPVSPYAPAHLSAWVGSLRACIVSWATACADYYVAAGIYEQLSGLSDAELRSRGLCRPTLAWDICQTLDRTNR